MERKAAYYHGLHAALEDLYGHIPVDTLADGDDPSDKMPFRHLLKAAESIFKNKGYKPEMLAGPEGRRLINDIYDTFRQAVDEGIADNDIPESMARKLDRDTFMFSGFKAHHELSEVGLALRDSEGKVKGYDAFEHDVLKIHNTYNRNYLKSEYGFAVASSQMAAKWQDVEAGRGRYDLQYRTAGDDRVREEHAAMNGITLPSDDPFWDKYYPPNGWRCRCTAVEVLKGKFPVSDSKDAERIGDNATTHLDRFGNNKDKIFRFNPGKEGKVFPPKHPYGKVDKEIKHVIESLSEEQIKERRINEMIAELPDNLSEAEKKAIATHNLELEKALGITKGKPMSVADADKQSANPNYVSPYIIDQKGKYYDGHNRLSLNPNYNQERDYPNSINCQTCAPAYALRLLGFNVTAKPCTPGSKLAYLSQGHCWEVWKNIDGTPAKHTSINDWLSSKKYRQMTSERYLEFFDECCKEPGVYELSIGWKNRRSGHATILQRFADGNLQYIEPQCDNSKGSGYEWKDISYLSKLGATKSHSSRGIMRVDNKLFNLDFSEIFNK